MPSPRHQSFVALVSVAIDPKHRENPDLSDAIKGLAYYDRHPNTRDVMANRVFGGSLAWGDKSIPPDDVYITLRQLGQALHPALPSNLSSWAHTLFDEFLDNPPKDVPFDAGCRRLAALIRLTLESLPPQFHREDTACDLANKIRRSKNSESNGTVACLP
jgi:hypothetical protein